MSEATVENSRGQERVKSRERLLYLPIGFHVLLALMEGPAHGAEITRRVVNHTMGRFISGTSLYDEMRRLEQSRLVKRDGPTWRSELSITTEGQRALKLAVGETKRVLDVATRGKLW